MHYPDGGLTAEGRARREAVQFQKAAAERGAWICFEDEAGHTLRPPKARAWAPRSNTAVIPVSGKGPGRISVAGLFCVHSEQRPHPVYRTKVHRARKGECRRFAETDYAVLINAARHHLKGPLVLILRQPEHPHQRRDAASGCQPGLAARHPATGLRP